MRPHLSFAFSRAGNLARIQRRASPLSLPRPALTPSAGDAVLSEGSNTNQVRCSSGGATPCERDEARLILIWG